MGIHFETIVNDIGECSSIPAMLTELTADIRADLIDKAFLSYIYDIEEIAKG